MLATWTQALLPTLLWSMSWRWTTCAFISNSSFILREAGKFMIRSMKNYSNCYEHVPKWNDGLGPTSQPSPLPWPHIRSGAASVCFCCIFSICSSWVSIKWPKFPPSYFDVGIITEFSFQVSDFWCFGYSVVSAAIRSGFRTADERMQERIHPTKWSYNALLWRLTCNF